MGLRYQYTTMDSIFAKLVRDFGDDFNEGDVIEWAAEALGAIGTERQYQEAVAFIEVKNYNCDLPIGIHNIIQIARDNQWTSARTSDLCPAAVKSECISPYITDSGDCDGCPPKDADGNPIPDYLVLDKNGMPLNDYDIAYYRPYFDLIGEYYGWTNSRRYKERYTPVRASAHTFSSASGLLCIEKNQSIYQNCTDEYTIVAGKSLRFSFEEGSIALAYNKQIIDENGYPMIPDHYSYQTAITTYVTMKILDKMCYAGREGACGKAAKLEEKWQWYCKQAGNVDKMPHGIDEHQNMLDQRSYILPNTRAYYGFFGSLNKPEYRKWNNNIRR